MSDHLDITFCLNHEILKTWDPMSTFMDLLMENPKLEPYRTDIFTILAELYTNALDHGILKLDSSLKQTPKGLIDYYEERSKRLSELTEGQVEIRLQVKDGASGHILAIYVEDSGDGFDYLQHFSQPDGYCGRGIPLLQALCSKVEFSKSGNAIHVFYQP